jgi:glycosyltransferase involved in cell wall biosynthesis
MGQSKIILDFASHWEIRGGVWRYGVSLARALVERFGEGHVGIPCFDRLPDERIAELRATGAVINCGWHRHLDVFESLCKRRGRFVSWDRILRPRITRPVVRKMLDSGIGVPVVYHGLFTVRQADPSIPTVGTIHDMVPLLMRGTSLFPAERFSRILESFQSRKFPIIVPSEATRKDVINLAGIASERIHVVYHGIDHSLFTPEPQPGDAAVLKGLGLRHGEYFLTVGNLEPRKNVRRLVDAYRRARQATGLSAPLVVSGLAHKETSDSMELLGADAVSDGVRYIGYCPEADLPVLYRGARAFFLVSLCEGFGFPVLEAMACGTPVIASDTTSLGELIGSSGIGVNPESTEEIRDAIIAIDSKTDLRMQCRERGLRLARDFTWERCADQTAAVYRLACGSAQQVSAIGQSAMFAGR